MFLVLGLRLVGALLGDAPRVQATAHFVVRQAGAQGPGDCLFDKYRLIIYYISK
jgi:hypothetical protein